MSRANENEEVGLVMEMSGLEVADSLLSLDCPSPLELLSPGKPRCFFCDYEIHARSTIDRIVRFDLVLAKLVVIRSQIFLAWFI